MFIVGSHAMRAYGLTKRKPADLDVICTMEEMERFCSTYGIIPRHLHGPSWILDGTPFKHVEFLLSDGPEGSQAAKLYTEYMDKLALAQKEGTRTDTVVTNLNGVVMFYAPPEVQYSMKRSHRFLPKQWEKNIRDYHVLKNYVDGIDVLAYITVVKQAETKVLKTPSLNKSKADFFDDHVSNHTFEHDQIHEVMAHRDRPMFEFIKIDADKVACSKEKFNALRFEDRMRCVLEEAYSIALERAVIPMLYEGAKFADSEKALQWSLMRISTTLCSGWFRDFAVENYPTIWDFRNKHYVNKFLTAVDEKRIVPIVR
jgi:hypothetical protein